MADVKEGKEYAPVDSPPYDDEPMRKFYVTVDSEHSEPSAA